MSRFILQYKAVKTNFKPVLIWHTGVTGEHLEMGARDDSNTRLAKWRTEKKNGAAKHSKYVRDDKLYLFGRSWCCAFGGSS